MTRVVPISQLYQRFLYRSEAGDFGQAEKFYKKSTECRDAFKPMLADIVKDVLGNANMSDDIHDSLLQRSDILKELIAIHISIQNNDKAGKISALLSLLTYLGISDRAGLRSRVSSLLTYLGTAR